MFGRTFLVGLKSNNNDPDGSRDLSEDFDSLRSPGPSKGAFAALAACLALTLATRFVSHDGDADRDLSTARATGASSAAQVAANTIGA